MQPRTRLIAIALVLMLVPTVALSIISIDSRVSAMINDLSRSCDLMIAQIFEEVRLALSEDKRDVPAVLQDNKPVRDLLDSTVAFGPAVVTASIIGSDSNVIVAANSEGEGKPALNLPAVSELSEQASRWLLFASLPSLLTAKVYEAQRRIDVDGRPVATITVGVTTALIADRARRTLLAVVSTALLVIVLGMMAVMLIANRFLGQLATLTRGLEELAAGGSPPDVEVSGKGELSTLAEKFNELSRQVRANRSRLDSDQSRLFDVVRSIRDGVLLLDSKGVILFSNKEAQEHLAAKNATLEGTTLLSALEPRHPLLMLAESTLTGTEVHDVPITLASGIHLVSFFRLGRERVPAGQLIVLRDLEPVFALEAALDSSNRIARLGTLISGLAHQLRSPLNGMNLRLELLSYEASEAGARHIDKLRREVVRLDQSVEVLLRFMRPEQLRLSNCDLNELLRELGGRVNSNKIKVDYQLDPALPTVLADPGLITEALTNLITNAEQAMVHGGDLTLVSKPLANAVEISIADCGPGIQKEQLDRIFDLYYTTKAGGSGLGLPFAMRAIELSGGKLVVESEPGKGTVCRVTIPIASNASAKTAVPSAA